MSMIHRKRILDKRSRRRRTQLRVRNRVRGSVERPRLAVYRSLRYIYAQLIDDGAGATLAHASSLEADIKKKLGARCGNIDAARSVGEILAERALEKGIRRVVFDRGGFVYRGRVRALAEGARDKGLDF
jgi:large subunit ribosomal protein L18